MRSAIGQATKTGRDTTLTLLQAGKVFEALTRLECQLRLNGYKDEARDLGFGVRKLAGVAERLEQIGTKLGLFDSEYRPVGLINPKNVS